MHDNAAARQPTAECFALYNDHPLAEAMSGSHTIYATYEILKEIDVRHQLAAIISHRWSTCALMQHIMPALSTVCHCDSAIQDRLQYWQAM